MALSGLAGLLRILEGRSQPWVLWLGLEVAAGVTALMLILKFGFPHLVADERRNSRVFLTVSAVFLAAVVIYGILTMEP